MSVTHNKTEEGQWRTTKTLYPSTNPSPIQGASYKINDKQYGPQSISRLIGEMLAENVSSDVIARVKMAQVLTADPNLHSNDCSNAESAQLSSIMKDAYKTQAQLKRHENEEKQEEKIVATVKRLSDKHEEKEQAKAAELKRLKNAKRNAKRKAKAKKTKKILNFTPTKEQEEWFWGAAPHVGCARDQEEASLEEWAQEHAAYCGLTVSDLLERARSDVFYYKMFELWKETEQDE